GIPVRLHITFLLFLAWLGSQGGLHGVALVVALFVCVIMHEFGHALTARRYGIDTRDITLYPIGGVAMLTGRLRPRHELWVALAGPAVNVVLALVIAGAMLLTKTPIDRESLQSSFLGNLLFANVIMAVFNLIPAFPMDGGRVLRALLARGMPEARATQIAAGVGQTLAIVLFFVGLKESNVVMTLIAFFVFLGAGQESQAEATRSFLAGHRVVDAMQTRFRTIGHGASLEMAAQMLLDGSQRDFPVVSGEEVMGIITREDIGQGLAEEGPEAYVAGYMRRDLKRAVSEAPLEEAVEMLTRDDPTPVLVFDGSRLLGMVTTENVGEFLMLEHARRKARAA
ncbi:site-2 protease family protein, partial [bacterium]